MSNTYIKKFIPSLSWGQCPEYLFITIEWVSCSKPLIDLKTTEFYFRGEKEEKKYEMKFDLFNEIVVEESKYSSTDRVIRIVLKKKNYEKWVRITKEKNLYKQNIKVNWNDYESDEEEAETKSIPMDFQSMINNPGFDFQKMMSCMNQNMGENSQGDDAMNEVFDKEDESSEDNCQSHDHSHDYSHEHSHDHSHDHSHEHSHDHDHHHCCSGN